MGLINQNLVSPILETRKTFEYSLSVLVGIDRFFYFIHDQSDQCLALRSYHFEQNAHFIQLQPLIQELLISDKLINHRFGSVRMALCTDSFTFIPSELYRVKHQETYAKSAYSIALRDELFPDYIAPIDSYTVYGFHSDLAGLLKAYFKDSVMHHVSKPLITQWSRLAKHVNEPQLFVNLRGSTMELAVFDKGKFLMYNTFSFRNTEDFLYYLLLVIKQLGYNPEKINVKLSGEITEGSTIYQQSLRYVRHLSMVSAIDFLRFDETFNLIPSHAFQDLFSLKLCE